MLWNPLKHYDYEKLDPGLFPSCEVDFSSAQIHDYIKQFEVVQRCELTRLRSAGVTSVSAQQAAGVRHLFQQPISSSQWSHKLSQLFLSDTNTNVCIHCFIVGMHLKQVTPVTVSTHISETSKWQTFILFLLQRASTGCELHDLLTVPVRNVMLLLKSPWWLFPVVRLRSSLSLQVTFHETPGYVWTPVLIPMFAYWWRRWDECDCSSSSSIS